MPTPRPKAPVDVPAGQRYLTLAQVAVYGGVSIRQIRKWLALPPDVALPAYRPDGRPRVARDEFDMWMQRYRMRGRPGVVAVLRDLGLEPVEKASG